MYLAVDDHSRYAIVRGLADETAESVTKHLIEIYQHYASKSIVVKRVLTDNGSGLQIKNVCRVVPNTEREARIYEALHSVDLWLGGRFYANVVAKLG